MNRSVLIISDDEDISVPLWHALERAGVRAEPVPADWQEVLAAVERFTGPGRAWAAIVAGSGRQNIDLIRRLRESFPELFLLAALASPGVATTQAVAAAGAQDFLVQPFDDEQIAACLRLWGETSAASSLGRMVCFLPARAGDGASTVALHVAEAVVHERRDRGFGGQVLLMDLDFQSGDVAFRLQLSPPRTLADALRWSGESPRALPAASNSRASNSAVPDSAVPDSAASTASGLSLSDSNAPNTNDAGSSAVSRVLSRWRDCVCSWRQIDLLASPPPGVTIPSGQLCRMTSLLSAARTRYPFVVCDMPPALHSSSKAVLQQAGEVYIVCTPEITSLHLAKRRVEDLESAGVERNKLRLVLNRAGSHPWIGSEEAAHSVGLPVSARLANDYAGLHAAILKGAVVPRRSTLGRQFADLTRQALGLRARAAAA